MSELPYVENSFEKSSSKLTKCRTNGVRISGTSINKFGFVFVTYLLPSQRALLPTFSVPSTALGDHSWPCGFTQKAFIPGYHHLNRASLFRVTSVPLPQNSSLLVSGKSPPFPCDSVRTPSLFHRGRVRKKTLQKEPSRWTRYRGCHSHMP